MQTMFDYIESQDQSFDEKPFTDADAVILSTVANLDFSFFYNRRGKGKVSLKDLAQDFINHASPSQERTLLEKVVKSPRYNQIKVSDAVFEIDNDNVKQFGAMTFWPTDDLAYVGYSGTGTSVVGYKEDMYMSFMDIVPSQEEAVRYLNKVGPELPEDSIVGGFSKGGNLAVFASAFSRPEIRKKIARVYNHDGPGFSELIQNEEKYKTLQPLVKSYIPKASIVGHLLEDGREYQIIDSTNMPIAQHQPYSWLFEGDDLKVIDKLSTVSNFFIRMQKNLLKDIPEEERAQFVEAFFDIITGVDPDDFMVFVNMGKKVVPELHDVWKHASPSTKKNLKQLFKQIGKIFFKSLIHKKKD